MLKGLKFIRCKGNTVQKYQKITIIGGAGFVGTNLCQYLADQQIQFEIIDLKQSQRFAEKSKIGDVRDIDSLRETITGDIVINLAAVHRDDVRNKDEYTHTNIDGARNVAQACTEKGIEKIIFTSSVAVYGFAPAGTGENGQINPFNEYGRTKYEAEQVLRQWQAQSGNKLAIIRPTVIFGEGNRGNVYNLLNQIASGKFIMIGAGRNKKSMAYIANVVAFLHHCITLEDDYALYNYIDTPDLDMNALVQQVRAKLKGKDNVGPRLPYWLGMMLGYLADGVARLSGKNLPISSLRIKKILHLNGIHICRAGC